MHDKIDTLIKKYEEELQTKSDNLEIMTKLGAFYTSKNEFTKAEEILTKVLEKDPKNLEALNVLGISYTQCGKLENAISKFEIAVKLYPNNAKLWYNLSEAYRRIGNYHQANICKMRAIQLNE
ncbi:MAG: tetratricopeptide repeat protein [Candidatus Helarchaeota archaeon]